MIWTIMIMIKLPTTNMKIWSGPIVDNSDEDYDKMNMKYGKHVRVI